MKNFCFKLDSHKKAQKAQEIQPKNENAFMCFLCLLWPKIFRAFLWLPGQCGKTSGGGDGVETEIPAGQ